MTGPEQQGGWLPIESAPDLERIMVAGWQPRQGTVRGYWFWHEGVADGGVAIDDPNVTHWCRIVLPAFPSPPEA